ncbi:hypothetical protein [Nostoc sp. UHCC 0251]|nr:hypothetical protein [Nostoc sp. UHCC 0251]MEA5625675.1 hypothetical protein [Nostoc sp. UHCC 0251]
MPNFCVAIAFIFLPRGEWGVGGQGDKRKDLFQVLTPCPQCPMTLD